MNHKPNAPGKMGQRKTGKVPVIDQIMDAIVNNKKMSYVLDCGIRIDTGTQPADMDCYQIRGSWQNEEGEYPIFSTMMLSHLEAGNWMVLQSAINKIVERIETYREGMYWVKQ